MPPAKTYTQAQKDAALALYETHGPTAVEKQLGIPKNTVAGWAKRSGVRTVRNELTRNAVEAKVVDGKLRRQNITGRLYGRAEKILDDLEAPKFTTILKGEYGVENVTQLDFVPPTDLKTLLQALGTALTTTAKLEAVDTDNGVAGAVSMLDRLVEQIGAIGDDGGIPEAAPVPEGL